MRFTKGIENPLLHPQFQHLYDFIIPVDSIRDVTANLALMDRLDPNATLTKGHLWKQIQFRKILYVDADGWLNYG